MKKNNILKKSLFLAMLCIILMAVVSIMVKYDVEGEKTLPFSISKILFVSTVDGDRNEDNQNIWNIGVTQVNDAYIYIDKTSDKDTDIKSISLNNFTITQAPQKGKLKLLRPTGEISNLYTASQQDYLNEGITYLGGTIDDLKSLEIKNSGGVLGFRMAITELGSFVSNENTEVIYDGRLLTNLGVGEEELKFSFNFDIIIETSDNIKYKATVSIKDMPVENFSIEGSKSIEITDFSDLVFKRI